MSEQQRNLTIEDKANLEPSKPNEVFLALCQQYGFVGYSFAQIGTKIEGEKRQKKPIGLPSWSRVNRQNFKYKIHAKHTAFAIITGPMSGITVIDCDTDEVYEQIIRDYPTLKESLTVKTRKGYHVYCQYVPKIKNNSASFKSYTDIDIRNGGGIIFAPPTIYDWFGERATYEFVNPRAAILAMPQSLVRDIKGFDEPAVPKKAKIRIAIRVAADAEPLRAPTTIDDEDKADLLFAKAVAEEVTEQIIRELVNKLPKDYHQSRREWIQLGGIIHHEMGDTAQAKKLFLELSRRSPKHANASMSDMDTVWKSYSNNKANPSTIASLHYAASRLVRDQ